MRLLKLHGLGNDFLVLLDDGHIGPVAPQRARALCERRTGVGADGLIRSERVGDGVLTFELLNADGSPAEMSGNGTRCLGLAAARAGWWEEREQPLAVRTPAGERRLDWQGGDLHEATLQIEMGKVEPDEARADLGARLDGAERWMVRVGNPHAVFLVEGKLPPVEQLDDVIRSVEPGGPADINYEFVVRAPGAEALTMVVRERGAGWTQACGTGSVAAAWAAHERGWVGPRVSVHNPGGSVQVDLSEPEARLTGPAVFIAAVEVEGGEQ